MPVETAGFHPSDSVSSAVFAGAFQLQSVVGNHILARRPTAGLTFSPPDRTTAPAVFNPGASMPRIPESCTQRDCRETFVSSQSSQSSDAPLFAGSPDLCTLSGILSDATWTAGRDL